MTHLANKSCRVVENDEEPMRGNDLTHYRAQVHNDWDVVDESHIARKFLFPNYSSAVEFANHVAQVAASEDHHPDIYLSYGVVKVVVRTHEVDGLHENDFIVAAKIDKRHREHQKSS